ncbi:eukaryotic translation initiation factor 5-like [Babylonia areolata]|uniref:eukaryotic translation initiation factor 5-like n=1 Tax=Babylonia areolata TaxID=304850 RepID=UPI003FD38B6F
MAVNIDRSNMDQFYRYKMPRLLAKVEGKGNGIKTVIVNMAEIAKALSRPPTYPTKFFGCELGAQTQFDTKNDRYIVNGSHDADKLQNLLDGFIKKFVLCDECSNPETNLIVSVKKQTISQRCIACGHNGNVDMRHKLTTFILKNPPDQDLQATTPSKGKKSKKDKDKKEENDRHSPEANAQQQMAAQRASGGTIDVPPEQNDGDDDDWGEDISEEAVRQRMDELSGAAKGLALTDDLEKTDKDRMDIVYKLIKSKRDSGELGKSVKEVVGEAERLEVKEKVPLVLVELLLTDKVLAQVKEHRILFLSFCKDSPKAQKYLVGGLEMLIGREYSSALMPRVPHILKAFYDLDILEEEVILDWAKKVSKKYVSKEIAQQIREKAKPFIDWLEQASEEEEDEEEEEEEEEVVYSTTGQVGEQPIEKPQENGDDEEEDFDIDAI